MTTPTDVLQTRVAIITGGGAGIGRSIAPDYTETPGVRGNIRGPVEPDNWIYPSPEREQANLRRIPLGRVGTDTECADATLYLASDMSRYTTGTVLRVDGGTWVSSGWSRTTDGKWSLAPGN